MTINPWAAPAIATAMRENVDRQLAEKPWPVHFTAFADAVRSVSQGPGRSIVLEVGCGVGHGVEILKMAGVPHDGYSGCDVNATAVAMANRRYPDAVFADVSFGPALASTMFRDYDIVVDGSCVIHADAWRAHLAALCNASRDAVILHRIPVLDIPETRASETVGYGRTFPAWQFSYAEVKREMESHGFTHTEARKADGDSLTLTFRRGR